jgi:DNA gyrase subunit A
MLVSNGGQLIRIPVDGIRMVSRASKGVRLFNTGQGERVVSVERVEGEDAEEAPGMIDPEAGGDEGEAPQGE